MSDKEVFFVFEDALRYTNYLKDIKGLSENDFILAAKIDRLTSG